MNVECLIAPSEEDMSQIVKLRGRVWCDEEGLDREAADAVGLTIEDKLDTTAVHYIVRHEDAMVAAARLTIHKRLDEVPAASVYRGLGLRASPPIGAFGRAVVTTDFRVYGIGGLLDVARYRQAQKMGCQTLITYAHPSRVEMLTLLGFEPLGPVNMSAYLAWPAAFERIALMCYLASTD